MSTVQPGADPNPPYDGTPEADAVDTTAHGEPIAGADATEGEPTANATQPGESLESDAALAAGAVVPKRGSRTPGPLAGLGWRDWLAIGLAFAAAFLLTLSGAEGVGGAGMLRFLGILALIGALVLLGLLIRDRVILAGERDDWDTFEAALPRGTRLAVPDGMNYAAVFPPALDGLRDDGPERFASGGTARRAILGEAGETHFCVFQHHPAGSTGDLDTGVATVGLVSLLPDREYDELPRLDVRVTDPVGTTFYDRFEVLSADSSVADEILTPANQATLMGAPAFDWSIIDNQLVTIDDRPRGPGQVLDFIRERIEPLAHVTANIPSRIETSDRSAV